MKLHAVIFGAALAAVASAAAAEDYQIGDVQVGTPWARATPRGANVAGAYMTITNKGTAADRLVSGTAAVANRFEVHSMVMDGGVAKMRPVEGGLEIKPGQTVELKPGAMHVMLIGLKQPLQQGEKVKGTLQFERAGKVDIEFTVQAIGAAAPAGGGRGQHSGH